MVAEHLKLTPLKRTKEQWVPSPGNNEQLDLGVYCDAQAYNFGVARLDWEQWQQMFRARAIDPALAGLTPLELLAAKDKAAEMGQPEKPEIDKSSNPGLGTNTDWMQRLANLNKDAGDFNS